MDSIKRLWFKPGSTLHSNVREGHTAGRSWKRPGAGRIRGRRECSLRDRRVIGLGVALRGLPASRLNAPISVDDGSVGGQGCAAACRLSDGARPLIELLNEFGGGVAGVKAVRGCEAAEQGRRGAAVAVA